MKVCYNKTKYDKFVNEINTLTLNNKYWIITIINTLRRIIMLKWLYYVLGIIISIIAFILYFGGKLDIVFDPFPLIIMFISPLFFQRLLYGKFLIKAFIVVFPKEKKKEELIKAYDFFKNYCISLWSTAILLIAISTAIVVKYLDNKNGLGEWILFMANILIWTGLINLLIIIPYKKIIRDNLIKSAMPNGYADLQALLYESFL